MNSGNWEMCKVCKFSRFFQDIYRFLVHNKGITMQFLCNRGGSCVCNQFLVLIEIAVEIPIKQFVRKFLDLQDLNGSDNKFYTSIWFYGQWILNGQYHNPSLEVGHSRSLFNRPKISDIKEFWLNGDISAVWQTSSSVRPSSVRQSERE